MKNPGENILTSLFRVKRGVLLPQGGVYGGPSFPIWAGFLLFVMFYVWPLLTLVGTSVNWTELSGSSYAKVFGERVYLSILANTARISSIVAVSCILIGFSYAVFLSRLRGTIRQAAFILGVLPILVNPLAIICAWRIVLERHGILNSALIGSGLASTPLSLCYNLFSVVLVMTYLLFPLVMLPCYGAISRLDQNLVAAAKNLGAGSLQIFLYVELPACLPGVIAGGLLAFVLALGYFVTPALLGGRSETMISMIIADRFNVLLDWQLGAALSVMLLLMVLVSLVTGRIIVRLWERHHTLG